MHDIVYIFAWLLVNGSFLFFFVLLEVQHIYSINIAQHIFSVFWQVVTYCMHTSHCTMYVYTNMGFDDDNNVAIIYVNTLSEMDVKITFLCIIAT